MQPIIRNGDKRPTLFLAHASYLYFEPDEVRPTYGSVTD